MFKAFYGRIYTSFKPLKVVSGLLVYRDTIVYSGDAGVVEKLCKMLECVEHDYTGYIVMPGFIDAHLHLDKLGLHWSRSIDLGGIHSLSELVDKIKTSVKRIKVEEGEWVIGMGFDDTVFDQDRLVDTIASLLPDNPLLVIRRCIHKGFLNNKAVGVLSRDYGLESVDNIVVEDAFYKVYSIVVDSVSSKLSVLEKAIDGLVERGVTTTGFMNASLSSLASLLELWMEGRLKGRVRIYLNHDLLPLLRRLGLKTGFGDSWFRIMGVKVLCDGSFGAHTAYLREPYSDNPSSRGLPTIESNELERIARECVDGRLQLALHTIGDASLDMIINVLNRFNKEAIRKLRFRLEHLSLTWDEQLEWIRDHGLPVVIQPLFTISDSSMIYSRLGVRRIKYTYRFKTMASKGIVLGLSSDAPVEKPDPWLTVYAAITRGELEDNSYARRYGRDTVSEKLDVVETLHYYTHGSAYSLHSEGEIGKLEPGYKADIIVVNKDPLKLEPREIKKLNCRHVFVSGEEIR